VAEEHPADVAEVYRVLTDEERSNLIFLLPAQMTASLISELDNVDLDEALEDLDKAAITEIINELSPDDAADVLAELTDEQQKEVLEQVPDEHAEQIEKLLYYAEDSAGGIMTPELVRMPESATVAEAIEEVRRMSEDEEIHYVYTVDAQGRLTGVVPLRMLVVSRKDTPLGKITTRDPLCVKVTDDQEHVANQIRKYDVSAIPVVDDRGVLVGRVTHDDIMDVAEEEADEDIYYMAGTEAAELEEASPARAAYIRLRWLLACMVGTAVSGLIVAMFTPAFDFRVFSAMVLFMPMMGAMGGNSGIQISTIIVRSLATGEMESRRVGRDFARELPITMIMAPVCGIFAALIAGIGVPLLQHWGMIKPVVVASHLSAAVGIGMTFAIACASVLGMLLPHVFRKVGVDPAIASGPIVTTTNDILCVSLYFLTGMAILR
jgi:magnesium transporter